MLVIKLSQKGKVNKRMFRLIISEKSRDPYGNVLETLGSYNPHTKELLSKNERISYWLSKGAQMTPTVNNLLVEKKVIEGKKVTASKAAQKSAKATAKLAAKVEKSKKSEVKTEEVKAEEVQAEEVKETEEKNDEKAEEVVNESEAK